MFVPPVSVRRRSLMERHPLRAFQAVNTQDIDFMQEGIIIQRESSIAAEQNRMFAPPMSERLRSFVERHSLRAFQAVNTQDIDLIHERRHHHPMGVLDYC